MKRIIFETYDKRTGREHFRRTRGWRSCPGDFGLLDAHKPRADLLGDQSSGFDGDLHGGLRDGRSFEIDGVPHCGQLGC